MNADQKERGAENTNENLIGSVQSAFISGKVFSSRETLLFQPCRAALQ
jgi:hypothetical protein